MTAVILSLTSLGAGAGCLPLPSSELQPLDAGIQQHPQVSLDTAQGRLGALPVPADPLVQAQLYAIVAEAAADLDDPDRALAAVAQGLSRLDAASASPGASRVRLRLQLLKTEISSLSADSAAAGSTIDQLLEDLPEDSLERTCALSERAIAYDFNGQPDRAVATALDAYRPAVTHGWTAARIEAAYTLAVNFRRAGLYDRAEAMIDEVIALEKRDGLLQGLSDAQYELGQLLVASGRFAEARTALADAKQFSLQIGDRLGAAAADLPLCLAEIEEHDLAAAQVTCNSGQDALLAARREDLAASMEAYRARLDLDSGRPAAALAKLDALLAKPIHRLLPVQESGIHRDRGRALAALHRHREAFAELSQAGELDRRSDIEQRHRQVAVLSSVIAFEALRSDNRSLKDGMNRQLEDAARQRRARILWASLAIVAIMASGIFICLLILLRRHNRRLRRYEIILNRAGSRAPHALLLLDEHRRVCFANRPLFGPGPVPATGASVMIDTPECLRRELAAAIDEALASGGFVSFDALLPDDDGAQRQFEVWVLPAIDGGEAIGVTLQSIDVTELRRLEREVLDGASRDRRHMGGELHEGLGQELSGVLLMLGNLATVIKRGGAGAGQLVTEIAEQIARSVGSARRLAQDFAPVTVERGSLRGALKGLVHSASRALKIEITSDCRIDHIPLSDLAADHLYQFCREAVIDAALRGSCRSVAISMRVVGDMLELRIVEAGRRAPGAGPERDGFRLKMMAYQARLMGGTLRWRAESNGTACVTMTVPMSQLTAPVMGEGDSEVPGVMVATPDIYHRDGYTAPLKLDWGAVRRGEENA